MKWVELWEKRGWCNKGGPHRAIWRLAESGSVKAGSEPVWPKERTIGRGTDRGGSHFPLPPPQDDLDADGDGNNPHKGCPRGVSLYDDERAQQIRSAAGPKAGWKRICALSRISQRQMYIKLAFWGIILCTYCKETKFPKETNVVNQRA